MPGFPWRLDFDVMAPRLFWCHQSSRPICGRTTTSVPKLTGSMLSFWHVFHHSIQKASTMSSDLALLSH